MAEILVVIPAYNEEANIKSVVERLIREYPQLDYVIINDGSTDRTAKICEEEGFRVVNLSQNLGLAGAFQTGMQFAWRHGYEYAVQFDGDGQHRPEYIEPMRDKMKEGYDIVIASRFVTEKKPKTMRMLGSNLIQTAIRLTTGVTIHDPTSGMRMFNRRTMEEFSNRLNYGPEPDTVSYLIREGANVAEIQVEMDERIGGVSYLTPWKASLYMLRMLCSILVIQNFRKREKCFCIEERKENAR